jgi:type VI secretion system protein ImpH
MSDASLVATDATAAVAPPGHGEWLERVAAKPYRYDFYQVLRRFEAAHPHLPRLGEAMRPVDEPLRVSQSPEMTFAPAALHALTLRTGRTPLLSQRIFGLLGPNGPLPTHLTELTRERARQHGDAVLQRFMDLLSHRLTLLFYRAWSQAQPALSLDRPGDTHFVRRLGALSGLGSAPLMSRDAAGDASKLHFTGRLARHVRDAEGLLAWCRSQFNAHVQVEQWCGHWMPLARDERSRLMAAARDRAGQGLGQGAVLGASVWDVQHKFRIVIGPLALSSYLAFLPGGADIARLQAIVRQWVGIELDWDLRLILARADVPRLRLGGSKPGMLGRTAWLGTYRRRADADDLTIDVDRTLRAQRHRTPRSMAATPA